MSGRIFYLGRSGKGHTLRHCATPSKCLLLGEEQTGDGSEDLQNEQLALTLVDSDDGIRRAP